MKKFTLLFVLSLFLFSLSDAQTRSILKSSKLVEAAPESAGISAERLARIDKMCEEEVAKGNLPGIVSLVARNGKIVHWKAYGVANENGDEMKRDAIFRIASQTKAITSTAVMMLWEEGKFQLDDPISKYIPEFKNQQVLTNFRYSDTTWTGVPVKNEITVRHLLTHTSGIGYGIIDSDERFKMLYQKAGVTDLFTTKNITIKESVKNLAKMPLHCEPGTQYRYCEGLDVLGYFIEVVSGMPFDQYLKIHIFDPLGMEDTWFYQPEKISIA
nr:serine hydrolase domain-containing protein [Draconibacterium orientale]